MRIAILCLQGAFLEHEQRLQQLGVETFRVRQLADWLQPKDGVVLPGGESTSQTHLLHDLQLYDPLRDELRNGLPAFGTCAGLILLSSSHLGTMDIAVRRNAYGRQLGSFHTTADMGEVGSAVPMTFIRAPYIERTLSPQVNVLAEVDGHIVAAQQGAQLVTAFHPELDSDTRVHKHFLSMVQQRSAAHV